MDPQTLATLLSALGFGAYVPIVFALIGLFSAISTVYPPTWPGAPVIRKLALLVGHAKPAATEAAPSASPAKSA